MALPPVQYLDGKVTLYAGDCREMIRSLPDASIDSVVTDPPYALVSIGKRFGKEGAAAVKVPEGGSGAYARASAGFMGKQWDTGETAFAVEFWAEVYRVLKPGGHVLAFSGTRTYHRMAVAIEDAGFEIRDSIYWHYGSGFPKSHDVSKGIDKRGGHHRGKRGMPIPFKSASKGQEYERTPKGAPVLDLAKEWQGWGTALKPATEPICLARKPLIGTVAENVLKYGTGAINIDGCRVGSEIIDNSNADPERFKKFKEQDGIARKTFSPNGKVSVGRWPANIVHDGSDEVLAAFPASESGAMKAGTARSAQDEPGSVVYGVYGGNTTSVDIPASSGSAARFFYSAKADSDDRIGSKHPTVKPVDLMRWLVRLVTPPGGTVLDPFAGTGTTGEAAFREGFKAILCEREDEYQTDIARRMALVLAGPDEKRVAILKEKAKGKPVDAGPLFEF